MVAQLVASDGSRLPNWTWPVLAFRCLNLASASSAFQGRFW